MISGQSTNKTSSPFSSCINEMTEHSSIVQHEIQYREDRAIPREAVLELYRVSGWSSAKRPDELCAALRDCHALITAWEGPRLVGLANAISDGHLVVYFPHAVVHPDYQRRGIGRQMMQRLVARYTDFHQLVLIADGDACGFYQRLGFTRAGRTEPMWIFSGTEH